MSGAGAFLFSDGVMYDLASFVVSMPAGFSFFEGFGINDNGQIVGDILGPATHAFLYASGTATDLGTLGGLYSEGFGLNNFGQATGFSSVSGYDPKHAFLYTDGTMVDLGTLGGTSSRGIAVNDNGQVVGDSDIVGDVSRHAFLYADGTMHDLGTLGGLVSFAAAINTAGQVVGIARNTAGDDRAFLYSDGTMSDLNSLVVSDLTHERWTPYPAISSPRTVAGPRN
jgi:probable HAF family extracellular repeat protein